MLLNGYEFYTELREGAYFRKIVGRVTVLVFCASCDHVLNLYRFLKISLKFSGLLSGPDCFTEMYKGA